MTASDDILGIATWYVRPTRHTNQDRYTSWHNKDLNLMETASRLIFLVPRFFPPPELTPLQLVPANVVIVIIAIVVIATSVISQCVSWALDRRHGGLGSIPTWNSDSFRCLQSLPSKISFTGSFPIDYSFLRRAARRWIHNLLDGILSLFTRVPSSRILKNPFSGRQRCV